MTMRGFACLSFVVVFTCVRLQPAYNTRSRTNCFQGWTGPDTGGSCSFRNKNLCNWTNSDNDESQWTLLKDSGICLYNYRKNENDRAWLFGPVMCEGNESDVCLTITYKSNRRYGAELSLYVCESGSSEVTCSTQSHCVWSTRDWEEDEKKVDDISFKSPGIYQMLIEGKKHTDWMANLEADVYIMSLVYKNTSCDGQHQVASTTQQTLQTTIDETTVVSSEVASACTECDTHQPTKTAEHEDESEEEEKSSSSITVPVVVATAVVLLVVAITVIIVVVFFLRRRKSKARDARKASDAAYRRNDSVVMVTNELYGITGGHNFFSHEESAGFLSEMQPLPPVTQTQVAAVDNDDVFYSVVDKSKHTNGFGATHNPAAAENYYENTGVGKPADDVYNNISRENQDHPQGSYDNLSNFNIKVKAV